MTYRSKNDTWLISVIAASVILTILAGAALILFGEEIWLRFIGIVIIIASIVPVLLTTPISYTIDSSSLHVRAGYKHWSIPLQDIIAVRPVRDWISSPALSLNRVEIEYRDWGGNSFLLISPARTEHFLNELASVDPELILEQGRLSRKAV
jgi:Bacterial PH domain